MSSEEMAVAPYSDEGDDDDDIVTLQMDAPLDDGEWMVQLTPYQHRRLSTEQLLAERDSGALAPTIRVWSNGMRSWTPLGEVQDFSPKASGLATLSKGNAVPPSAVLPLTAALPPAAAPVSRRPVPLPSPPPPRLAPTPSRPASSSPHAASSPLRSSPVATVAPSSPVAAVSPPPARLTGSTRSGSSGAASPSAASSSRSGASGKGSPSWGASPTPPRVTVAAEDEELEETEAKAPALEAKPAQRVDTATSVAVDFDSEPLAPPRRWGALSAQVAAAMLALAGTSYGLSRAGVFESGSPQSVASVSAERSSAATTRVLALTPAESATPSAPTAEAKKEGEKAGSAEATAAAAEPSPPAPSSPASDSPAPPAASEPTAAAAASEPAAAASEPAAASPAAAAEPTAPAPAPEAAAAAAVAATPAADAPSAAEESADTKAEDEDESDADSGKDKASSAKESAAERKAKRAARRAAAIEARRTRRAAGRKPGAEKEAAASAPAAAEPAASSTPEPGSNFDRQAAQAALSSAADQAKNCRPIGGPSGVGAVQVQYEPTGKVSTVTIVTPGFENSETAACIQMLFRRAKIPQFTGTKPVVIRQRFEIP